MSAPIDGVMSGDFLPADVAAAATADMVMEPQLSRVVALRSRCNEEHRVPTPDELAGLYDAVPLDPQNPRHRLYATAAARAKAEAIRREAGVPADKPTPASAPQALTTAGILGLIDAAAERLNVDAKPDERGVVTKYRPRPDAAVTLAARLAGGTVAPTDDEIRKTLVLSPHLRVAGADHAIPTGGAS